MVSELECHTVASACTETLTLRDVNVACITETLNILVANISGFTVLTEPKLSEDSYLELKVMGRYTSNSLF